MNLTYLFEICAYYNKNKVTSPAIEQLLTDSAVSVCKCVTQGNINSYTQFFLNIEEEKHVFTIAEFPGNCSSLVVSGIQSQFMEDCDFYTIAKATSNLNQIMLFSEKLAVHLNYALLFVTTTSSVLRDALLDLDYYVMPTLDSVLNLHSGRENIFLVKKLGV
jgi:hypothetical protein